MNPNGKYCAVTAAIYQEAKYESAEKVDQAQA